MPGAEIVGIGAVTAGFGALVWKMWQDHTKLSTKMTEALERNARSHQQLSDTLKGVRKSVEVNTEVTKAAKQSTDSFSTLLLAIIKDNNGKSN